jgi:hypothetical protein
VNHDLRSAGFHADNEPPLRASFDRASDTVAAIRNWLEERCSADELRRLPSVTHVSVEGHLFDPD